jgi:hypothetical protein
MSLAEVDELDHANDGEQGTDRDGHRHGSVGGPGADLLAERYGAGSAVAATSGVAVRSQDA